MQNVLIIYPSASARLWVSNDLYMDMFYDFIHNCGLIVKCRTQKTIPAKVTCNRRPCSLRLQGPWVLSNVSVAPAQLKTSNVFIKSSWSFSALFLRLQMGISISFVFIFPTRCEITNNKFTYQNCGANLLQLYWTHAFMFISNSIYFYCLSTCITRVGTIFFQLISPLLFLFRILIMLLVPPAGKYAFTQKRMESMTEEKKQQLIQHWQWIRKKRHRSIS